MKNISLNKKFGFSLLEMTVVLIIMSVLASAVIPVLTRSFLDKAGEKVSLDISAIQDAARAYYVANNAWPTSVTPTGVTPATDLETNGFLPSGWIAINPFGNAYTASVSGSVYTVSTQVTNGSQIAVMNRLPASSYSGNTVSSSVPPPGQSGNSGFGHWQSLNFNQIYQATSDGQLQGSIYLRGGISGVQYGQGYYYTSSTTPPNASPEAAIQIYLYQAPGQTNGAVMPFNFAVRKGDYYELAFAGGNVSGGSLYFLPQGS